MGGRKALRALAQPTQDIAKRHLGNDIMLTTLPEVGKKTAETIARELQEVASSFAGNDPVARTMVEPQPARTMDRQRRLDLGGTWPQAR